MLVWGRGRHLAGAFLLIMAGWSAAYAVSQSDSGPAALGGAPITVGILHSRTGTMAVSERTVIDATLHAIDELNRQGGVLGRAVKPIVVDGRSDWGVFAAGAEQLITVDKVSAVFGCWTSACRRTVKPIFERHDAVLFYPVQYEGLETSANMFLVCSVLVFPGTANKIITSQVTALKGEVVGEAYAPLGAQNFDAIVDQIRQARPDVIFNTINGDSNLGFHRALRAAGITPAQSPVMSFSIAEAEVKAIGPDIMTGDYAARNYFQTVDTPENRAFVAAFKARYGRDYVTTAPMEAAYFGVMLWARAVREAGSADFRDYRATIKGQSMAAPGGTVTIDPATQHTWKTVRIGRIRPDGDFEIVWDSQRPVRPVPYPSLLPRSEWAEFLDGLYQSWGNNWAAPSPAPEGRP